MRTLITADIHGSYKALKQCLERSLFDYEKDRLIVLGDVVDGYPDTPKCIRELLKIKNRVDVQGNHDVFLINTINSGICDPIHYRQGGKATMDAYKWHIPKRHLNYLLSMLPYYIDEKNNLYVHGGVPMRWINEPIKDICPTDLMWDRSMLFRAQNLHATYKASNITKERMFTRYNKVYVGHTTTECFNSLEPVKYFNVIGLDTGCGWSGKLTIWDRDTEEYWQSDLSKDVYPEHEINKPKIKSIYP